MKPKPLKFYVTWTEYHRAHIVADNQAEAERQAHLLLHTWDLFPKYDLEVTACWTLVTGRRTKSE